MSDESSKPRVVIARPPSRSLEDFKTWITVVVERLTGRPSQEQMPDEWWAEQHRRFWEKADSAANDD